MNKVAPTTLLRGSFGTTNIAVKCLKLLSLGARAPQEAGAFFRLVARSISFVIVECIRKFERIERSTNTW